MEILAYLISRIPIAIYQFVYDWYVRGFYAFWRRVYVIFKDWDRFIAFRPTLRHWFQPLYQDYTTVGYVLGFIFRTGRIIIGGAGTIIIFSVSAAAFFVWAAIPVYFGFRFFNPSVTLPWL